MDSIAGTGFEQERQVDAHPPSFLVIVLDTNPSAWHTLLPHLPLDRFIADILVFINAHLACNHANRVAVLASHCKSTHWLFPSSPDATPKPNAQTTDAPPPNPNKYRPFVVVEQTLRSNLATLLANTTEDDVITSASGTNLASTLTVAIGHISRLSQPSTSAAATNYNPDTIAQAAAAPESQHAVQNARILIASTSGNLAAQYISLMNLIFAAQHLRVPLDILKLEGDSVLLQQASYTTQGVFLSPIELPSKLSANSDDTSNGTTVTKARSTAILPILLFAFLPDPATRRHLVPPTAINVDFRAACFCHRRVVDIGYVCSICLSIFCDEGVATYMKDDAGNGAAGSAGGDSSEAQNNATPAPRGMGACLTCGTLLSLKVLDGESAGGEERPRKKKKKKRRDGDGAGDEGTPVPA